MSLKHRKFDREFKLQVCREMEAGVKTRAQIGREYELSEGLAGKWLDEYRHNPNGCFTGSGRQVDRREARISQLEAALGRTVKEQVSPKEFYRMIKAITVKEPRFPLEFCCRTLEINRSGYYHWLGSGLPLTKQKQAEDSLIRDEAEKVIAAFPGYGYRRITRELQRHRFQISGDCVNHKRVNRVLRDNHLLCKIKRVWIATTDSKHSLTVYPNLIKKLNFIPSAINQLWVADITYIKLLTQFVYLATILDAFSRKVIGWCLAEAIDHYLTAAALKMALKNRGIVNAQGKLIHHSDKGVQYCDDDYTGLLDLHGIVISMSRKGSPWENGIAESFFKTLKKEEVYLNEYENIEAARANISRFIKTVYNEKRLHSSIGYLPPDEFENQILITQTGAYSVPR